MIYSFDASLAQLSVHKVGNRLQDEFYALSDAPLQLEDELLPGLLKQYFLQAFEKQNEIYRFYHSSENLSLNELYHFVSEIFNNRESFHENSGNIAKYLYEKSNHPKIKGGELYVALFEKVQIEGELLEAIGVFKSENKETYLKVYPEKEGFQITYEQEAVNIQKLDKGVLIFNTEKAEGYKVAVVDHTNRGNETVYWKDDFLGLRIRNDQYNQTHNTLSVYKTFVTQKLDDEFEMSKADKIDLLNRSMSYFKEKETFDIDEFSNEVIGSEQGISSFKNFKNNYEKEFDVQIPDSFEISEAAVKKQNRIYKSVLKLDKNFHIYIHGSKELIEKGFDDDRSMNYYKVYFKEEQ